MNTEAPRHAGDDHPHQATINQLAMFQQARDSREWAVIDKEGRSHPTWDEVDPQAREEYLKDATAIVDAMLILGWTLSVE